MLGIADQLDAAIGAAPPDAPALEPTLALGRSALRRRRISYAAGVVAATLVIGGTAWALAPDGGANARDDSQIANRPDADEPWAVDEFLRLADSGDITINPDAEVLERTVIKGQGERTVAFHLRVPWRGGEEHFVVTQPESGAESSVIVRTNQGLNLREWAREVVHPEAVIPADDAWVRFDTGSHLVPLEGVDIVEQLADPGFGDNFARRGEPTAAAEVTRGDVTWFLAVRPLGGDAAEAVPYRADQRIQTFGQFLEYARQQYATNAEGGSEGMR